MVEEERRMYFDVRIFCFLTLKVFQHPDNFETKVLPANDFELWKWKLFAEFVHDKSWQTESKQQITECKVEDENVSCGSHFFLSQNSRNNHRVAHHWKS